MVNKSVETRVTISVKDGTDKHVKSVSNKDVDLTGPMEDPKFQIKVLESAILKIREEMEQTTLEISDKPSTEPTKPLKTGTQDAKDAASKANKK
jgi:hypothetical protein